MFSEKILLITLWFTQWQSLALVMFAMFMQFVFSPKKTWRLVFLIVTSSIFIAWIIIPSIVETINAFLTLGKLKILLIENGSPAYNAILGLSTLISIEIMALLVKITPKVIEKRVSKFLGVDLKIKDGNDDT